MIYFAYNQMFLSFLCHNSEPFAVVNTNDLRKLL